MALVKMGGHTFRADPVEQTKAGDWLMRSQEHTGRLSIGSLVLITPGEVVEMFAWEIPGSVEQLEHGIGQEVAKLDPKAGLPQLEKALAEELKTLRPAAEILAEHRANLAAEKAEATKQPERPF
jgi:hypothetical protein